MKGKGKGKKIGGTIAERKRNKAVHLVGMKEEHGEVVRKTENATADRLTRENTGGKERATAVSDHLHQKRAAAVR
eukprot:CAMPEP_0206400152 /NCGR_PEP_ID=MMETSP0294-20121207/25331_1 /ASSEMBLY_ACC=CAM_ASM_000327 /TAXON_ID=39354 /ORGANISM="Heterosigma akashiwo, Strain CCMP2393" /LENGTH=74 /DNA_ID=CAMNT_0053856261 /DNA_START=137 /DNA_END=357 /DNA_ORIENTATION=+